MEGLGDSRYSQSSVRRGSRRAVGTRRSGRTTQWRRVDPPSTAERFSPIRFSVTGAVTRLATAGRSPPRRQPKNALHYVLDNIRCRKSARRVRRAGEETCLRDSDCGPLRKRRMSHRTLPVTRLPSTLPRRPPEAWARARGRRPGGRRRSRRGACRRRGRRPADRRTGRRPGCHGRDSLEPVVTRATPQGVGPVLAGQEVVAGSRPRRNRKAGSRTGGRRGAVMPGRAPTANAAGKSRREITKGTCRTGESRQVAVQATIKVDWRGYAVHEG